MNLEEYYEVSIDFDYDIDETVIEREKILLIQYLPEIFMEMQNYIERDGE